MPGDARTPPAMRLRALPHASASFHDLPWQLRELFEGLRRPLSDLDAALETSFKEMWQLALATTASSGRSDG